MSVGALRRRFIEREPQAQGGEEWLREGASTFLVILIIFFCIWHYFVVVLMTQELQNKARKDKKVFEAKTQCYV